MSLVTGDNGLQLQQPSLFPITALAGTSVNYANINNLTFVAVTQYIGQMFNRSNATVAMTDTLPNPQFSNGNLGRLPNGWNIKINNVDASASITLSPPSGITINGSSSLTITAGHVSTIYTDGLNYFSETAPH